jgi:hypothetical protein
MFLYLSLGCQMYSSVAMAKSKLKDAQIAREFAEFADDPSIANLTAAQDVEMLALHRLKSMANATEL